MGSGWNFDEGHQLESKSSALRPLEGGGYIPTPTNLKTCRALVNVKNQDSKCFAYSVLAGLHPVDNRKHPEKPAHYTEFLDELDFTGIEFPIRLSAIPKFERQNRSISICVLGLDDRGVVVPRYVTRYNKVDGPLKKREKEIDLLLLEDGSGQQHYALIRHINRLLSRFTAHNGKLIYCRYCIHRFASDKTFRLHVLDCQSHEACRIIFPSKYAKKKKTKKVPKGETK